MHNLHTELTEIAITYMLIQNSPSSAVDKKCIMAKNINPEEENPASCHSVLTITEVIWWRSVPEVQTADHVGEYLTSTERIHMFTG